MQTKPRIQEDSGRMQANFEEGKLIPKKLALCHWYDALQRGHAHLWTIKIGIVMLLEAYNFWMFTSIQFEHTGFSLELTIMGCPVLASSVPGKS